MNPAPPVWWELKEEHAQLMLVFKTVGKCSKLLQMQAKE